MPSKPELPPGYFPLRHRLPVNYYALIGRVITRWAIIEYKLDHLVFTALDISQEEGRLSVRGQRASERIKLVQDILHIKKASLPVKWKEVRDTLEEMESFRNRLAHSVWIHHSETKTPVLQDTSTKYITDLPPKHRGKIDPVAVSVPLGKLKTLAASMDRHINVLSTIEQMLIAKLKPSHGTL